MEYYPATKNNDMGYEGKYLAFLEKEKQNSI
jgi:hypothetical protein